MSEHRTIPYSKEIPVPSGDFEISQQMKIEDEPVYVIKEARLKKYLKVSPVELYLWQHMDGHRSIADLNALLHNKFGVWGIERIDRFVELLDTRELITIQNRCRPQRTASKPRSSLFKQLLIARIEWAGLDRLIELIYQRALRFLFTRTTHVLLGVVTLGGVVLFAILKWRLNFSFCALTGYSLCESLSALNAVLVTLAYFVIILIFHELAHGLTCKHFGRHINAAGFMLYFGMFAFFVDTTDVWMSERRERVLVSWAGPYANFLLSALASILSYLVPYTYPKAFLFHFATVSVSVGLINLIPLLKLDGYYILEELLDTYNLRKKAFKFILSRNFLQRLRRRQAFTRKEIIYVFYGIPAFLGSICIVLIAARIWADLVTKVVLSMK